jgi:hypothetical protein
MRKIDHFKAKGGQLVSIRDSLTCAGSKATWSGATKRFWVKAQYIEALGDVAPSCGDPLEVYLLEDAEPDPAPAAGWCYARGFFG